MNEGRFEIVPPPNKAPVDPLADAYGLADGLHAEMARGQFRCDACNQMKPSESMMVMVPDGVRQGDPDWSVTETARLASYNGDWSGWCLDCAPKKPKAVLTKAERAVTPPRSDDPPTIKRLLRDLYEWWHETA